MRSVAFKETRVSRSQPPNMKRVAFASSTGTIIEFYDFAIFGTASALVFSKVFFPSLGASSGIALSLATFGVAFVARPFGSILFGHFGDRLGRKRILVVTLLLMGGSTVAVGLLPSADRIGIAAPIILVALRIIQGLAVGGEWAGASLLTAENAPAEKRGFYGIFPQLGVSIGFILSSGTFLGLSQFMSDETFLQWGWRLPFLLSFVLVGVGFYIRTTLGETQSFENSNAANIPERFPIVEVLAHQWRTVLVAGLACMPAFALFYIGVVYLTSYGITNLALNRETVLALSIVAGCVFVGTTCVGAIWSDRIGRRRTLLVGNIVCIFVSLATFPILDRATPFAFLVGVSLVVGACGFSYGPMASYLPELFSVKHRYTGAGFVYNLAAVLGGAITPLVAASLLDRWGSFSIGLYLAAVSAIGLLFLIGIRETKHTQLDDETAISKAEQLSMVIPDSGR
jgi:metabolite-proton symporter